MPQAVIMDRSPHSSLDKSHRPEQTLHYQNIEPHYPEFRDMQALQGKSCTSCATVTCRFAQM